MPQTIRFRESIHTFQIDFNRHVSNIVYIQWMEMGRLKLLQAVGLPVEQTDADGYLPVLVETRIIYKRPLFLGESVDIELWISELSGVHAWMDFRFQNPAGDVVAEGKQKGIFLNLRTNRPRRLSESDRAIFLPYLVEPENP